MSFETYLRGLDTPHQWQAIFEMAAGNYRRLHPESEKTDQEIKALVLSGLYQVGAIWKLGGLYCLPYIENYTDFQIQVEFGILRVTAGRGNHTYAERL